MIRIQARCMLILSALLFVAVIHGDAGASWFWTQSDWSGGAYESAADIDPEIQAGELVLSNDHDRLIFAFDATDWDGVWALEAYEGVLYIGACDFPNHADFGDIMIYDYALDSLYLDIPVEEEGINVFKVRDGTLYSPGTDALGPVYIGNIYYKRDDVWTIKATVPLAAHVYDIEVWQDKLWVTTGCMEVPNHPGILYSSDDMGDTWAEELRINAEAPLFFRRLYGLGTYGGSLFVNSDFEEPQGKVVYEFTGTEMISHIVQGPGDHCFGGFMEWGGKLAFLTRTILDFYDGQDWTFQVLPLWSANFSCRAMESYADRFYIGGIEGAIFSEDPESEVWTEMDTGPFDGREIEDFAVLHGRLYAGTLSAGEVYVTPSALSGTLSSEPHAFPAAVCEGTLSWSSLEPSEGTALRFQLRSAESEALLAEAEFLGPDGTTGSWYLNSGTPLPAAHCGDQWFQYRVWLETDDPRLAPVLEEFVLEVDDSGTGLPGEAQWSSDRLLVWPNPFASELRVSLLGDRAGSGRLRVFDIRGRCVRELAVSGGSEPVQWDGRDAGGTALSAGVYLLQYDGADGGRLRERVVHLR